MTKQLNTKFFFFVLTLLLAVTVSACVPKAANVDTLKEGDDAMMEDDKMMKEGDDAMMEGDSMMKEDGDSMMKEGDVMEKEGDSMMIEDDASVQTFNITGKNFEFSQKEIRVKKGDKVVINFTSDSGFHDWVVDEFSAATSQVNTGGSTSVEFIADKTGTFEFYCSVGSHRAMGMVGNLIVE